MLPSERPSERLLLGHSGKDKMVETVGLSISGCQEEEREGGMNRQNTEAHSGSEIILHGIIMGDTYHYTFVNTHRM